MTKHTLPEQTCEMCGRTYQPKQRRQRLCGKTCRDAKDGLRFEKIGFRPNLDSEFFRGLLDSEWETEEL